MKYFKFILLILALALGFSSWAQVSKYLSPVDVYVYPEDYDRSLKEGDSGYIEPIDRFESEIDQSVLDRFGVRV